MEQKGPKGHENERAESNSRRQFIGKVGKAALASTIVPAIVPIVESRSGVAIGQERGGPNSAYQARSNAAFQFRVNAAQSDHMAVPPLWARPNNGDEVLYPNRIANYSKGLPHQANGEVVPSAYNAMLAAINSGDPNMFEQIPLGGDRKFVNPQSGYAFDLEGMDCFLMTQPPPPAFASREIAAEIAENYWMAILRDVPFTEYANSSVAAAAADDLTMFGSDFKGPHDQGGQITPGVLFRGLTPGDKAGPYLSQFWYQPCSFGANDIPRKMRTVLGASSGGQDYGLDLASWLSIQNGISPAASDVFDPTLRYLRNGRDLGQWVHVDVLFQAYFQAFLIITGTLGVNPDAGNPYNSSATQDGFGTFGPPHAAALLCEVATRALKAVWNQKWMVHRRLRPEVFAERVDRTAYHGGSYPVHKEILASVTSGSRLGGYLPSGNAFLPLAFPEGSPMHPSYGAGHGTVAGACTTILKAWFDESAIIPNPLVPDTTGQVLVPYSGPDTLTVGGELNKLASNVAIGRNIAGVHWRSDATASLELGESIAISILRDQRAGYNEQFAGFSLTKFDGTTIVV